MARFKMEEGRINNTDAIRNEPLRKSDKKNMQDKRTGMDAKQKEKCIGPAGYEERSFFFVCVCVCVSDKEEDFLLRRHLAPTVDYLSTVVASSRRFYLNFRIPEQKQLKRNWRVQRV